VYAVAKARPKQACDHAPQDRCEHLARSKWLWRSARKQ
jgi:hypothetical protein